MDPVQIRWYHYWFTGSLRLPYIYQTVERDIYGCLYQHLRALSLKSDGTGGSEWSSLVHKSILISDQWWSTPPHRSTEDLCLQRISVRLDSVYCCQFWITDSCRLAVSCKVVLSIIAPSHGTWQVLPLLGIYPFFGDILHSEGITYCQVISREKWIRVKKITLLIWNITKFHWKFKKNKKD